MAPHRHRRVAGLDHPQMLLHRWLGLEAKEDEADADGASLLGMEDPAVGDEAGRTVEDASAGGQSLARNGLANEGTKIWSGSEVPSFPMKMK